MLGLIGGFERISESEISVYAEEIENVMFGMKMLKWDKHKQKTRTVEMLQLVQLEPFAHQAP